MWCGLAGLRLGEGMRIMRRIENFEDQLRGVVTYEFADGRRVAFDERAVRQYGAHTLARDCGLGDALPTDRVDVVQCGRKIGTVAPDFDPMAIRSASFLYDPRPGDFTLVDGAWIAAKNLGPGDFECVPGFVRERPS